MWAAPARLFFTKQIGNEGGVEGESEEYWHCLTVENFMVNLADGATVSGYGAAKVFGCGITAPDRNAVKWGSLRRQNRLAFEAPAPENAFHLPELAIIRQQ